MKKKNKRLITILIFLAFFAFGCAILLINLRENLIFFYSPTEVFEKQIETTQMIDYSIFNPIIISAVQCLKKRMEKLKYLLDK